MNLRQISEKIRDHLIQQGRVASNGNTANATSMCRYLAENGDSCAVGCLIKPELYTEKMEHNPASAQVVKDAVCASLGVEWTSELAEMLKEWQFYHDTHFGPFLAGRDTRSPEQKHNNVVAYLNDRAEIDHA